MNALINFDGVLSYIALKPLKEYVGRDKIGVTEFIDLVMELWEEEWLDGQGKVDLQEVRDILKTLAENTSAGPHTIEWEGEVYPEYIYSDEGVMDLIWEQFKHEYMRVDSLPTWVEIDWEASLYIYTRKFGFKEVYIGTHKFWFRSE